MTKNIDTIFLDIDDVLVDFVGAVCKLYDIDKEELHRHRINAKEWDITSSMAKMLNVEVEKVGLWPTIFREGPRFWAELELFEWFDNLIELMYSTGVEWYLLSSPTKNPDVYRGKISWINSVFGPYFNRYILTSHKGLCAREGTLLIDDSPHNVESFLFRKNKDGTVYSSGGLAYLFGTSPLASYGTNDHVGHLKEFLDTLL